MYTTTPAALLFRPLPRRPGGLGSLGWQEAGSDIINTDLPKSGQTVTPPFEIAGWAVDIQSPQPLRIDLNLFPAAGGAAVYSMSLPTTIPRPDVVAFLKPRGWVVSPTAGFSAMMTTVVPGGAYLLRVAAVSADVSRFVVEKDMPLTILGPPAPPPPPTPIVDLGTLATHVIAVFASLYGRAPNAAEQAWIVAQAHAWLMTGTVPTESWILAALTHQFGPSPLPGPPPVIPGPELCQVSQCEPPPSPTLGQDERWEEVDPAACLWARVRAGHPLPGLYTGQLVWVTPNSSAAGCIPSPAIAPVIPPFVTPPLGPPSTALVPQLVPGPTLAPIGFPPSLTPTGFATSTSFDPGSWLSAHPYLTLGVAGLGLFLLFQGKRKK